MGSGSTARDRMCNCALAKRGRRRRDAQVNHSLVARASTTLSCKNQYKQPCSIPNLSVSSPVAFLNKFLKKKKNSYTRDTIRDVAYYETHPVSGVDSRAFNAELNRVKFKHHKNNEPRAQT